MAHFPSLSEAIRELVHDGDTIALEGFTHLIPYAAGHEIIKQGRRDLTIVRLTPDLLYDQMIGMGCVRKMIFAWGGNPGVGMLHRFRDAIENGWPHALEIEELSHAALSVALTAGASGLPMGILRGFIGSDLPKYNKNIKFITCPFSGDKLAAVRAINPDVSIIHAQKADRKGNVLLWGIIGVQKECALAAKNCLVTVEEIVDELDAPPNACILPSWTVHSVCHVPGGAFPSYVHDYYERNNAAYIEWDAISKSRETFSQWMETHIMKAKNFEQFKESLSAHST